MSKPYTVLRKLQEQSGSYFVILPRIWIDREELKQSDEIAVIFNEIIKLIPKKKVEKHEQKQ